MSVPITITTAGLAALVNAQATGTQAITITAIGVSPTAITPDPAMTTLPGELKRLGTVSGTQVSANTVHVVMEDASQDAYSACSFALYLGDGTLFALYGQAAAIITKTASSVGMMAVDITFAAASAAAISFGSTAFNNPPASTTMVGVTRFATTAEAKAGQDNTIALTPYALQLALLTLLLNVDGAGSKLDADLLDGQEGAWYANIPARLGYTPLNAASFTQASILALLGYTPMNAANFTLANILALLGYTPLNAASYTAADVKAKLLTVDGTGSGIDADLWQGQTPAEWLAAQFPSGSNANGTWQKTPDGAGGFFIEQWGTVAVGMGEGPMTITFPIPFTDASSVWLDAIPGNPTANNGVNGWFQYVSNTTTTATFYLQYSGDSNTITGMKFRARGR